MESKMTTEKFPSEPSMDEILASIRQIISEDSKTDLSPSFDEKNGDILDLTHFLPEESSFVSNENREKSSISQRERPRPSSPFDRNGKRPATEDLDNLLLSPAVVSETETMLRSLSQLSQDKRRTSSSPLVEGIGGQAIESQLREILKPLLKEWLDANLPLLVRWVVTEQVEKIMHQDLRRET